MIDLDTLLVRCRRGDALAWEELVRRFQGRIFGLAVAYLRDREEARDTAQEIFSAVGKVVVLDEDLMDAVTGLSGSGPAYLALVIEALADGGVRVGLDRQTAMTLAAQTVLGSAKLLIETGTHPGQLKDMVTSPGGTAIAGIHTLEAGGLRRTLIDAVERIRPRPLLIVMGTEESGQPLADELFAKVREYAQTWRIQGAGHGNFTATAPEEYPRRLRAFLDEALLR